MLGSAVAFGRKEMEDVVFVKCGQTVLHDSTGLVMRDGKICMSHLFCGQVELFGQHCVVVFDLENFGLCV